jgi:hypothetical protein
VSLFRVILTDWFQWEPRCGGPMLLRLSDPSYTDRLANFLRSLGQTAIVAGPGQLEIVPPPTQDGLFELGIYLRVWTVLYPDADVQLEGSGEEAAET